MADSTKAGSGEVRDGRKVASGGQLRFPRFISYAPSRVMWYDEAESLH